MPLRRGRRGLGFIARKAPRHALLGYFFQWPDEDEDLAAYVAKLKPSDAVLVARFGDAGFTQGSWTVVLSTGEEKAMEWPIPVFRSRNSLGATATYTYADSDLYTPIPSVPRSGEFINLDTGGFAAGAVEETLSARLK